MEQGGGATDRPSTEQQRCAGQIWSATSSENSALASHVRALAGRQA